MNQLSFIVAFSRASTRIIRYITVVNCDSLPCRENKDGSNANARAWIGLHCNASVRAFGIGAAIAEFNLAESPRHDSPARESDALPTIEKLIIARRRVESQYVAIRIVLNANIETTVDSRRGRR
jgi:hypothetical protein